MKTTKINKNDLDSILDDALDDYEQQELKEKIEKLQNKIEINEENQEENKNENKEKEINKMKELLNNMNDPSFGITLQNTLKSLSTTKEGNNTVTSLFQQLSSQYDNNISSKIKPINPNDKESIELSDRQIAGTLQMLGNSQQGMEGFEVSKLEDAGETMMEDMMAQFEALGEKEDYNQVRN